MWTHHIIPTERLADDLWAKICANPLFTGCASPESHGASSTFALSPRICARSSRGPVQLCGLLGEHTGKSSPAPLNVGAYPSVSYRVECDKMQLLFVRVWVGFGVMRSVRLLEPQNPQSSQHRDRNSLLLARLHVSLLASQPRSGHPSGTKP